jgi:WD40 repeat protein
MSILLDDNYTSLSVKNNFALVGGPGGISIVDLANSQQQKITTGEVNSVKWMDSDSIAAARSKVVEVWSNSTCIWTGSKHLRQIRNIDWNGIHLLATCSTDAKLLAWDIRQPEPAVQFNATRGVGIYCLAWSKGNPNYLASAHDTALKIWDARLPRKSLSTLKSAHPGRITCLDWQGADTSLILSAGLLSCIKIWNAGVAKISPVIQTQTPAPVIKSLFCPDKETIVYASEHTEGKIHFLTLNDLKHLKSFYIQSCNILDMDWGEDSQLVALGADRSLDLLKFNRAEFKEERLRVKEEVEEIPIPETEIIETNLSLEEELHRVAFNLGSLGIHIEEKGIQRRYCVIKIGNERHFVRYMVTFPKEYPSAPPAFYLQDHSLASFQDIKKIEKKLESLAFKLSSFSKYSFQELCEYVILKINEFSSERDTFLEDVELAVEKAGIDEGVFNEQNYRNQFLPFMPCSSGHAWHPSGKLFIFEAYASREQAGGEADNPHEDFFEDLKGNPFESASK